MSYRAFKRLLGETSLERKCRWLIGTGVLVLMFASFYFYARQTEVIAYDQLTHTGRALVSPIVAWLVHEDCPVSGEIFSAAGGRIARMFIGLCEGYYNENLTLEDVRDNFTQIRSTEGYTIPNGPADEFAALMKHFK